MEKNRNKNLNYDLNNYRQLKQCNEKFDRKTKLPRRILNWFHVLLKVIMVINLLVKLIKLLKEL